MRIGGLMGRGTRQLLAGCCLPLAMVAVLAGCSSSKKPGNFASTVPSTAGPLSKTEFISKMNAVCSALNTQRQALPQPSGLTDYTAISANLSGTLRLLPALINQADQLIGRTADKAALTTNWLSVEKSDFAAIKPIAERMVADSNAKNADKVAADGEALSGAPNHSDTIATYMTSYGLTSCATLENG
jgi:hypothetical protein